MKEINRIHIAKIPYDIEIAARKEIELYISKLEKYADDAELLFDIEIRITELLEERGVKANGVISVDDVAAIKDQLGDPKDFMSGDNDDSARSEEDEKVSRKLFRNVDNAILGGVLSGLASYLRVETVWVRLFFVILFLMSSGSLLVVYIVLWIIVPPAKSATEKLQMSGQPVNLSSIKELNENEPKKAENIERADSIRRIISTTFGSLLLISSLAILAFTGFAAFGIGHLSIFDDLRFGASWEVIVAYILAITAGVLLSTLFLIFAYAAFIRKFTKRIAISMVVVVMTGLLSFGTAVGLVVFGANGQIRRYVKEVNLTIPEKISNVNSLEVDSNDLNVEYIVSEEEKVTFESLPQSKKPSILIDGTKAVIDYNDFDFDKWPSIRPTLTIYGPKLTSIQIENGNVSYSATTQDLSVEADGGGSSLNVIGGEIKNLTAKLSDGASIDASGSAIESVSADIRENSGLVLGVVGSLTVVSPKVCSSNSQTSIAVNNVNSGQVTINGEKTALKNIEMDCGTVTIGEQNL